MEAEGIYPVRRYWCGFHENGKQKWFIELNNGKIIAQKDNSFSYWNKKFDIIEIKKHKTPDS